MGGDADSGVAPKRPIAIPLLELTTEQAKQAVESWAKSVKFNTAKIPLFGNSSPKSWTISIMSDLKPKAHDITEGRLRWILRTAMPLRHDFSIWLNDQELEPSKVDKPPIRHWIIGKDLVSLPRPKLKGIKRSFNTNFPKDSDHRFGLKVPGLGRITGYADAYMGSTERAQVRRDRQKPRILCLCLREAPHTDDGHFGISPNELKHGIFSRFRLVVHMDQLDKELRSTRETVGEGPMLETAREVLWAIFNKARQTIEEHDQAKSRG